VPAAVRRRSRSNGVIREVVAGPFHVAAVLAVGDPAATETRSVRRLRAQSVKGRWDMTSTRVSPVILFFAAVASALTLACESRSPLEVNGIQTHSLSVRGGEQFGIRLGTVGPGEYLSPPQLSDSSVQFIDAQVVPPYNPGGPTQLFRFNALVRGRSVITFQHSEGSPSVTDTVTVN